MGTLAKGSTAVNSILEFDTQNLSKIIDGMDALIAYMPFFAQQGKEKESQSESETVSARTFQAHQQNIASADNKIGSEQNFGSSR